MSHLLTAAAIDQSGADLTIKGDLNMSSGNYIGISGTGGYVSFDSSNNLIAVGPGSSTNSHIKFASTVSSQLLDSNGNAVLEFNPATSSPTDYLKITPGTSSTNSEILAQSSGTSANIDITTLGASSLVRFGSGVVSFGGLSIAGGSGGSNFTTFKSGTTSTDDSITWPANFSSSDEGKVLKVASGASTGAITLELAADASGAATYNDVTSSAFSALSNLVAGNIYAVNDLSSAISQDLPAGSDGDKITVIDANGGATSSNTITLTRAGSDTINGDNTVVLDGAYQALTIQFNATTSKWNIV